MNLKMSGIIFVVFVSLLSLSCGHIIFRPQLISRFLRWGGSSNISVTISTSIGSKIFDKKKTFSVPRTFSVGEVKNEISKKYPGNPPKSLQRIFWGMQFLNDSVCLGSLTNSSSVSLILDNMFGTNVYDRNFTVIDSIDAFLTSTVHSMYFAELLRNKNADNGSFALASREDLEVSYYSEMLSKYNESFYQENKREIEIALEKEKNGIVCTDDIISWTKSSRHRSLLEELLAHYCNYSRFKISRRISVSVVLLILDRLDIISIPYLKGFIALLWLSQIRALRLAIKLLTYFGLIGANELDFISPLLSAPYQTLGNFLVSSARIPVVPVKKTKKSSNRRKKRNI